MSERRRREKREGGRSGKRDHRVREVGGRRGKEGEEGRRDYRVREEGDKGCLCTFFFKTNL